MSDVEIDDRRLDFIQSLRELADWLETTPAAQVPFYLNVYIYLDSKEQAVEIAKQAGDIEKSYQDNTLHLQKKFGDAVRYTAGVNRNEVCTKRVIGTETKLVNDYANIPKIETEVEIVEWDCNPLLKPTEG